MTWRLKGQRLLRSSKSQLFLRTVALYSVWVSNAFGSVKSSPAVVTVERTGVYAANDLFEDAIELKTTYGSSGSFNSGLSSGEAGEPDHADISLPLNSLWWKWTAPSDGLFKIRTDGSDFDTTLAAYSGSSLLSLDEIASNDDANGLQSEVAISVIEGEMYYFAVDGYSSAIGAAFIEYSFEAADQKPSNDDFAEREPYDATQGGW